MATLTNVPANQTITVERDSDVTLEMTMATAGVTMTGWAISFVVRPSVSSSTASISLTVGSGVTIASATVLQIAIADTDTASLSVGRYVYEIKRTDAGSEVPLARGDFQLVEEIV